MHRLLLLLGCLALPLPAGAQAWTQPHGGAYVKLAHGRADATERYDVTGARIAYLGAEDAFTDRSLYLYAEVGLTKRLTLVGLLPYKRLTVQRAGETFAAEGVGSVQLGVRMGLREALGLRGAAHTAALTVLATLPTGYVRNAAPALGPGQADLQATLGYGLSLYPLPGYAQAAAGFRYRSALFGLSTTEPCRPGAFCAPEAEPDYDHQWLFALEGGLSAGRWALVQVRLDGAWSNRSPETLLDPRNPLPTRERFVKVGVGATLYPWRTLGLSVQHVSTPVGRNTLRPSEWFFGVEYRVVP